MLRTLPCTQTSNCWHCRCACAPRTSAEGTPKTVKKRCGTNGRSLAKLAATRPPRRSSTRVILIIEVEDENERIDFDGLGARLTRVPIEADNILSMAVNDKAIVYSISDGSYYGRDGRFKPQIHVYKIKDRKDRTLVEDRKSVV